MAKVKPSQYLVSLVLIIVGLNVVIDTLVEALPLLIVFVFVLGIIGVMIWRRPL